MTASKRRSPGAPTRHRRARRFATNLLFVIAVGAWALFLRPDMLGGSASYVLVSGHSMRPGLETGDLVITHRKERYAHGDVIAFRVPDGEPGAGARVIHRITGGSAREGFRTQGDNRQEADIWRPRPRDIEGRLWLRLPKLGTLMLMLSTPVGLAAAAGLLTFLTAGEPSGPRRRRVRGAGSRAPISRPPVSPAVVSAARVSPAAVSPASVSPAPAAALARFRASPAPSRPHRATPAGGPDHPRESALHP